VSIADKCYETRDTISIGLRPESLSLQVHLQRSNRLLSKANGANSNRTTDNANCFFHHFITLIFSVKFGNREINVLGSGVLHVHYGLLKITFTSVRPTIAVDNRRKKSCSGRCFLSAFSGTVLPPVPVQTRPPATGDKAAPELSGSPAGLVCQPPERFRLTPASPTG
jgi:hypothetical protein